MDERRVEQAVAEALATSRQDRLRGGLLTVALVPAGLALLAGLLMAVLLQLEVSFEATPRGVFLALFEGLWALCLAVCVLGRPHPDVLPGAFGAGALLGALAAAAHATPLADVAPGPFKLLYAAGAVAATALLAWAIAGPERGWDTADEPELEGEAAAVGLAVWLLRHGPARVAAMLGEAGAALRERLDGRPIEPGPAARALLALSRGDVRAAEAEPGGIEALARAGLVTGATPRLTPRGQTLLRQAG